MTENLALESIAEQLVRVSTTEMPATVRALVTLRLADCASNNWQQAPGVQQIISVVPISIVVTPRLHRTRSKAPH